MTTGLLFAVLAGVAFGVYQILNRLAGQILGVTRGMTVVLATCLGVTTILIVVLRATADIPAVPVSSWFLLAAAGIFHFVSGLSFIALSQRSVGAGRTGSLVGTTPLFATLTGFLILGEVVSWQGLVGIAMIVAGAVIVSTEKS